MTEGVIVRSLSGFYTVRSSEGTFICRAKGKFRKDGVSPLVGDRVTIEPAVDGTGMVADLLPRRNAFGRPAVANVDALVMLASNAVPVTDPMLIDRIAVRCEKCRTGMALVVNKCDLAPGDSFVEIYRASGCPVFLVSACSGEGLEPLRAWLSGKTVCFTGNSGVGKSTLLNALCPGIELPTGEISEKLGRGRHTTRHVELYALDNETFIADTPGFASFEDVPEDPVRKEELAGCFPEFRDPALRCRFDDCTHRLEPGCAVRAEMDAGNIHPSRYRSYLRMYEEAEKIKDWEIIKK